LILETLPGWVWTLIYLGVGFFTFRFVALNIFKPILKYRETQYRLKVNAGGGGANPLMAYNSASEMLGASEAGIMAQMEDISRELKVRHVDPMQDQTYQLMMNQRDKIVAWRQRLQNPIWGMLDQTFFPVVKGVIPDVQKAVKRLMKDL